MLNRIKYYARNLIFLVISLPPTIVAAIRFKISYIKHKNDPDTGIGLMVNELNSGGLESIVMDLYQGYRKYNKKSYILIVDNKVSDYIKKLEDDPRQFQILYFNRARLLNYCRINKIYIMHYHFSTFAMKTLHFLGVKTAYTIHNTYVWFTPRMWRQLKKSLKKCDHLIAVSDFAKEYFIKKTGFKNIITINNGIDIEYISKEEKNNNQQYSQTRKDYGFKASDKIIAMVSSFSEQKYHLSLVGAMEKAFNENKCSPKNTKVLLCGPIIDKKLYNRIKKTIKKSPYSTSFIIQNPIKPNEIGYFLRNIPDLIVLPSLYEGGVPPLIIIEALVCNKPVIMTDLDISNGPLSKYIFTVPRACDDLSILDVESIRKIVYSKDSDNKAELAETISAVLHDPTKNSPRIPKNILHQLDKNTMTKSYINLFYNDKNH